MDVANKNGDFMVSRLYNGSSINIFMTTYVFMYFYYVKKKYTNTLHIKTNFSPTLSNHSMSSAPHASLVSLTPTTCIH